MIDLEAQISVSSFGATEMTSHVGKPLLNATTSSLSSLSILQYILYS